MSLHAVPYTATSTTCPARAEREGEEGGQASETERSSDAVRQEGSITAANEETKGRLTLTEQEGETCEEQESESVSPSHETERMR